MGFILKKYKTRYRIKNLPQIEQLKPEYIYIHICLKVKILYKILMVIWYKWVVIDDATYMQFLMTLKNKNVIYTKLVTIFYQVKTYTKQDLKYFQSNKVEEYQGLQLIFQEKNIEWEKSIFYA